MRMHFKLATIGLNCREKIAEVKLQVHLTVFFSIMKGKTEVQVCTFGPVVST